MPFDAPALRLIGEAAQGSMRDALSITDQAIAFGHGKVDEQQVRQMLGNVDRDFVWRVRCGGRIVMPLPSTPKSSAVLSRVWSADDALAQLARALALAQPVPASVDGDDPDAAQHPAACKVANGGRSPALLPDRPCTVAMICAWRRTSKRR